MEREVGKKNAELEREMETIRNEILNVTSSQQQQQQQQQQQRYIYPQNNGGGFPALFDTSPVGIAYGEGPSSSSSIWGPFSPNLESERLMEEFGIFDRFSSFQVGNNGQGFVRPETSRNDGGPMFNPFGNGYAVGEGFGDQKSNANWASESVTNQFFKHHRRHLNSPVMANPIASPSPCSYSNFQEENSLPYVNGLQQQNEFQSDWNTRDGFYLPFSNLEITHPQLNSLFPMLGHQVSYLRKYQTSDALLHEDKFMFQGNDLRFQNSRRIDRRGRKMLNSDVSTKPCGSFFNSTKYESLRDLQGCIYLATKDQHGCRFLQRKLEEKKPEYVEIIFNELISHVPDLMANSFANYLMQALFDVCTEGQRLEIILAITKRPFELIELCMNSHGTRAVQKLVDTIRVQRHITMFMSALEPAILVLIKDLNGHHVIQRCLHCFSSEDNKFVLEVAAKNTVGIATDQYGCCVLQRCIDHSTGQLHSHMIINIATNALLLAQHRFGNNAVQYVIEKKFRLAYGHLVSLFKGNFVELSKNKFSSNVVEKCLLAWEDGRKMIILELLSEEHFDMLLQHQYANYVIHRAFTVTKGPLYEALVAAAMPHAEALRTHPYSKKIFSRACFRN